MVWLGKIKQFAPHRDFSYLSAGLVRGGRGGAPKVHAPLQPPMLLRMRPAPDIPMSTLIVCVKVRFADIPCSCLQVSLYAAGREHSVSRAGQDLHQRQQPDAAAAGPGEWSRVLASSP